MCPWTVWWVSVRERFSRPWTFQVFRSKVQIFNLSPRKLRLLESELDWEEEDCVLPKQWWLKAFCLHGTETGLVPPRVGGEFTLWRLILSIIWKGVQSTSPWMDKVSPFSWATHSIMDTPQGPSQVNVFSLGLGWQLNGPPPRTVIDSFNFLWPAFCFQTSDKSLISMWSHLPRYRRCTYKFYCCFLQENAGSLHTVFER